MVMPHACIRNWLVQPGYGRTQLVKAVSQVMAGQLGILLCLWISALIWPVYWSLRELGVSSYPSNLKFASKVGRLLKKQDLASCLDWKFIVLGSVAGIAYLLTLLLEGVQRG